VERYFAGLDVHKEFIYATVIDEKRNVFREGKISCSREAVENFLTGIPSTQLEAAMEACGIWTQLYDYLETRCRKAVLVNPLKTRLIASARIKTDKIDSKILAELLRADLIAESYVPPPKIRALRETVRQRQALVKIRTSIKNQIHAILRKNNIKHPDHFKDIFTVKGRKWLKSLENPQINIYLKPLDTIEEEIKTIWHQSKHLDDFTHEINLIKTMPGIGNIVSIVIMTEIVDVKRFKTPRQLCSYAGITPSIHQSGNTERRGKITKQGSKLLRWALVQSAQIAINQPGRFQHQFYRLKQRKHRNVAVTAVARKMLYIIWHMLTYNRPYLHNHPKQVIPQMG